MTLTDVSDEDIEAMRPFARSFKPVPIHDRPFAPPLTENQIQRAVFSHFKTRGAPNCFALHPKNGGVHQRGRRAGINTGLGVIPGLPDVFILAPGQHYALELKTEKGKLSKEQIDVLVRLGHCGTITGVAYGLDEALAWLEGHGLLKGSAA